MALFRTETWKGTNHYTRMESDTVGRVFGRLFPWYIRIACASLASYRGRSLGTLWLPTVLLFCFQDAKAGLLEYLLEKTMNCVFSSFILRCIFSVVFFRSMQTSFKADCEHVTISVSLAYATTSTSL